MPRLGFSLSFEIVFAFMKTINVTAMITTQAIILAMLNTFLFFIIN